MKSQYTFFGKKLPAWMLLAALVVVGAGAATGLVLKDQIDGTTTIAVSQALYISDLDGGGDADEFLGTINDNRVEWAAHFEANNGDELDLDIDISNDGGSDTIVALLTMDIPEGITVSEDNDEAVQTAANQWKFEVSAAGTAELEFTIAIEDAAATGFYELTGVIIPVNV